MKSFPLQLTRLHKARGSGKEASCRKRTAALLLLTALLGLPALPAVAEWERIIENVDLDEAVSAPDSPGESRQETLMESAVPSEKEDVLSVPTVAPPESFRLLKNGSSGEDVARLQLRLTELGFSPGSSDGIYGRATREAVKAFQKLNGLSVDGAAGPKTQARLYSADAVGLTVDPADQTDVLAGAWPLLVNKEFPVGNSFVPSDLVLMTDLCDSSLIRIKYASTQGVRTAVEALVTMLKAARADGIVKWQCSAGYRSYDEQANLLNNKIKSYLSKNSGWSRSRARRAALQTVAEPGASEHHTGLSFDINVPGTSSFAGTAQCRWLHEHCWEYGFIVRYQEGKTEITGFAPEAWHIRYVGPEHALVMRDEDLCLEEYLTLYRSGGPDLQEDTQGVVPGAADESLPR